jgi:hypothetical protein
MLPNFFYNKLYFQNLIPFKCSFNSSNSSSNFALALISSTKLEKGLQPILRSLGQFCSQKIIYINYLIANDIS